MAKRRRKSSKSLNLIDLIDLSNFKQGAFFGVIMFFLTMFILFGTYYGIQFFYGFYHDYKLQKELSKDTPSIEQELAKQQEIKEDIIELDELREQAEIKYADEVDDSQGATPDLSEPLPGSELSSEAEEAKIKRQLEELEKLKNL
ncbi:hypothetical protein ACFL3E_00270 [Patescibacteria group bacterium]